MFAPNDVRYMKQALVLADRGRYTTDPNPRVGCIIVKAGRVIGCGWHQRAGQPHAEINALNALSDSAEGATAYVTLEPCSHFGRTPPCCDALVESGVNRVVVAMEDPNPQVSGQGIQRLRAAGIRVDTGVCEDQARQLNRGFIKRMNAQMPWVRAKVGMTLDGCTALSTGESKWITSEASRHDVQFWRAQSSCVVTGVDTVLADDPGLNVRLSATSLGLETGPVRQPLRVVLDTHGRLQKADHFFQTEGDILLLTAVPHHPMRHRCEIISVEQNDQGELSLPHVLKVLVDCGMNDVLIEAGATLTGAFLSAGLLDELICYVAPVVFGHLGRHAFTMPELLRMNDRVDMDLAGVTQIGDDVRLIYRLR